MLKFHCINQEENVCPECQKEEQIKNLSQRQISSFEENMAQIFAMRQLSENKPVSKKNLKNIKTVGDYFDCFNTLSKIQGKELIVIFANYDFVVNLDNVEQTIEPIDLVRHIPIVYRGFGTEPADQDVQYWVIKDEFAQEFLRYCQYDPEMSEYSVWLKNKV